MTHILPKIWFNKTVVDSNQASLHVASSAVLYWLSVYTVFPILKNGDSFFAFRIQEHLERLQNSAKLIGMELPYECSSLDIFTQAIQTLVQANQPQQTVFARATIHVDELIPGTRTKWLHTTLSVFLYEAKSILPQDGARLKTSVWRRNPDFCIPSRAKVNGAYVNSVLAKQDAIDSGYDDAFFLDLNGHVCELSAANIFLVRNNTLITPSISNDILEGINRKTILEVAHVEDIRVEERTVDLTELYIADEIFACGTSAFFASIIEIDGRSIGMRKEWPITKRLKERMQKIQSWNDVLSHLYLTKI
jgi:branched-chain amino acid aminotransferase